MKNQSIFTFILVFIFSISVLAQKDTIWFDANWNTTLKNQASYYRTEPIKKDNGYLLTDYYLSGVKQMDAFSTTQDEEHFDGVVTWCFENGNVMQTVTYKDGKLEGFRKNYHESGSLKNQYSYTDGKIAGEWVEYFENAKLSEKGNYKQGDRNGSWKEYYKSGKLKGEGNYAKDKKVGDWKMYYYDGAQEE
jgi:antitoxin component YwqK of YwqJK toxin-antitoxin module